MSMDTRALLEELSGIGVGVDEDDPIAQAALAQAAATDAAAGEEPEAQESHTPPGSAAPRRWRGAQLLRDAARASSPTTPERASEESADEMAEAAVDAAWRTAQREAEEPDEDAEGIEDSPTVVTLLTDIRALLQQQVRLLSKLVNVQGDTAEAVPPRARKRPRVESASEAAADPAVTPETEPAVEDPAVSASTRQEQLQAALALRAERRKERAARERQQLAELIAQGLSSEDAMLRIEAERAAREEAEEAAEDAVLDDVPMAASGVPGLDADVPARRAPRGSSAKGSSTESFDVDFDVSALSAKGR